MAWHFGCLKSPPGSWRFPGPSSLHQDAQPRLLGSCPCPYLTFQAACWTFSTPSLLYEEISIPFLWSLGWEEGGKELRRK